MILRHLRTSGLSSYAIRIVKLSLQIYPHYRKFLLVMKSVSNKNKSSANESPPQCKIWPNLRLLPDLVLLKIFSYLPYFPDVSDSISKVCKRFNDLSSSSLLPTSLHVNDHLLKRRNIDQILDLFSRAVGLRHLIVTFEYSTYTTTPKFDVLKVLQITGEKTRGLRSLRIIADDLSSINIPTLESYQILCSSLLQITQNNALEMLEFGVAICSTVLEEAIDYIKNSLEFLIISVTKIPMGYTVFEKLCSTNLKKLHIYIKNQGEKLSYEGISELGNVSGLHELVLFAQQEMHCNLEKFSASFFENLVSIRMINVAIYENEVEKVLEYSTKLTELEVSPLKCSVDYISERIPNAERIEKFITLHGTYISVKGMNVISSLNSLKELCIQNVADSSDLTSINIMNAFKTGALYNLVRCELDFVFLDDICLKIISDQCQKLEIFGINNSEKLTDNGVNHIAFNLYYLKELSLEKCVNISEDSVKVLIANCKNLELLNIKYTFVSKPYCDKELFIKETEVHCSHKGCVNYKSDVLSEYFDDSEYDDDSYSFKDYRYRR